MKLKHVLYRDRLAKLLTSGWTFLKYSVFNFNIYELYYERVKLVQNICEYVNRRLKGLYLDKLNTDSIFTPVAASDPFVWSKL